MYDNGNESRCAYPQTGLSTPQYIGNKGTVSKYDYDRITHLPNIW